MPEESFQERTEKATPRRRQKAREEGKVARSNELNSAVILCLGLTTVYFLGSYLTGEIQNVMKYIFSEAPSISCDSDSLIRFINNNMLNFFVVLGPIFVILAAIAYGINVLQVGVLFTTKPLEPKFDKLNIANGIKRLFSVRSLVELARDVIKLILIAVIGYLIIDSQIPVFFALSDHSINTFAGTMGTMALSSSILTI